MELSEAVRIVREFAEQEAGYRAKAELAVLRALDEARERHYRCDGECANPGCPTKAERMDAAHTEALLMLSKGREAYYHAGRDEARADLSLMRQAAEQHRRNAEAAEQGRDSAKRAYAELLKINGALHRNAKAALGEHAQDGLSLAENVAALVQRVAALEEANGRYARLLVRAGILSQPSIGGQTVTAWKCCVCESEQVSGSTAHGSLCPDCRRALLAATALGLTGGTACESSDDAGEPVRAEGRG